MTVNLSLIVDLILVGLLVATIAYAIILNRQIVRLRDSRSELADLIRGLNDATANADAGVRGLRKTAGETGEQLQRAIDKAGALRDELAFILEAGEALADRLGAVSSGAAADRSGAIDRSGGIERSLTGGGRAARAIDRTADRMGDRTDAERPLAERRPERSIDRSRGGGASATAAQQPAVPAVAARHGGGRTLIDDTLLAARAEAARQPDPAAPAADTPRSRDGQDGLSRAERELLQAIENRR